MGNTILDRTGAPAYTWLLCLTCVCFILFYVFFQHSMVESLFNAPPVLPTISAHCFYYSKLDDSTFASESDEKLGRFVGIAKNVCGHFMTFKILTNDTKKIIFRSNVRSALDPNAKNLRLDPISGEMSIPVIIKSLHESDSRGNKKYQHTPSMPVFHPSDIIGRTFLMDPQQEDGQRLWARIVAAIEDHEGEIEGNPTQNQIPFFH
jgi:hypothetical protein